MKNPRTLLALIAIAAAAATFTGCKTNEANYRAAYEIAKNKQQANTGADPGTTLHNHGAEPRPTALEGGVTLPLITEPIAFTRDGGATRESLQRYNVVVGRFRQIFNAKAMRGRLMEGGYPGACIVNNRDNLYFVIAATCATPAAAAEALAKVSADPALKLTAPLPFILQPAHLNR